MACCNGEKNESIKCTVTQCANHCDSADYCSLSSIQVGTHEANPTMVECTDCNSFELKEVIKNFRTLKGTVEKLCFFYSPFVYGENYGE